MFSKEVQDAYARITNKTLTPDEFLAILVSLSPTQLNQLSRLMLAEVSAKHNHQ